MPGPEGMSSALALTPRAFRCQGFVSWAAPLHREFSIPLYLLISIDKTAACRDTNRRKGRLDRETPYDVTLLHFLTSCLVCGFSGRRRDTAVVSGELITEAKKHSHHYDQALSSINSIVFGLGLMITTSNRS